MDHQPDTNFDTHSHEAPGRPPGTGDDEPERVIPATEIFRGRTEVWIELNGERYRLRITRRGRLILQK